MKNNFQTDVRSRLNVQTESTNERISFFNSSHQLSKSNKKHSPSNDTPNDTGIRQLSNHHSKLKEYLLDDFKKDPKAKKIIEELFSNPSVKFSNGNTIVVSTTDTEVNVRDFV